MMSFMSTTTTMYRAHSPYGQSEHSYPAAAAPAPYLPPVNGNVQAGDTAYAQVMSSDGRVIYQIFRATPASYQTANGIINGVQWMANETTASPPPGSRPANPEFVASWMRSAPQISPAVPTASSSKSSKSDRDSGKRKSHNRHQSDYDSLQNSRDRDGHGHRRRSTSFNASAPPSMVPFPGALGYTAAQAPGYPPSVSAPGVYSSPYAGYPDTGFGAVQQYGIPSGPYGVPPGAGGGAAYSDINRQMNDLELHRSKESNSERDRKVSEHRRSRRQSTHEPSRQNDPYGNHSTVYNPPGGMYPAPAGAYPNGAAPYPGAGSTHSSHPSPNIKEGEVPYPVPGGFPIAYASSSGGRQRANSTAAKVTPPGNAHGSDIYGTGLEGLSKAPSNSNAGLPRSRATTPNSLNPVSYRSQSRMGAPSPHPPPNPNLPPPQLPAPESFSRAINASLSYLQFKPTKIHNMDDFFSHMPKMPSSLESHDVRSEDWFRFVEDLALAWTGRLPVGPRDSKPPRPSVIAAELLHTWNTAFFEQRGVELVLYKGRQRRSGRLFGRDDLAAGDEGDESSSSSSAESSDSDDPYPPPRSKSYGRDGPPEDLVAVRRRYYDQKVQAKERRRERRRRQRERRKRRNYTVYAICAREGGPKGQSLPPMVPNNMPLASAYPGMLTVPPPPTNKRSKSHSRGQSTGGNY